MDEVVDLGLPDHLWTSDVWEVVRCRIPQGSQDQVFAETDRRLSASVTELIAAIDPVRDYFARWSDGRYRPEFIPGADVVLNTNDSVQVCIDHALEASSSRATGVIVIADAPHRDDRAGGWTQPGRGCSDGQSTCAARSSQRAVYLGANDFWSLDDVTASPASVPLDLVEHEMGHSFGWPHSSRGTPGAYDSVIDVMSDSAAPRRQRADRRDGPGVLALHRLGAGWLDRSRVMVVVPGTGTIAVTLGDRSAESPNDTVTLIIVELADEVILTIESVTAGGDEAHLARSGVAVHLVEWGANVCAGAEPLCLGVNRRVTLLGETADGLLGPGEAIDVEGIRIAVTTLETVVDDPGDRSVAASEQVIARVTLRT